MRAWRVASGRTVRIEFLFGLGCDGYDFLVWRGGWTGASD